MPNILANSPVCAIITLQSVVAVAATGQTQGCLISFADTSAMNGYLQDFIKHVPSDEHVLMVLDRAGWHCSKALCIAQNLTLLLLPAYSPELNPVELLWEQMRDKYLSNQVFRTADQLDTDGGKAWCDVTCELKPSALYAFLLGSNRRSITKIGMTC